jgi:hypothetical protein
LILRLRVFGSLAVAKLVARWSGVGDLIGAGPAKLFGKILETGPKIGDGVCFSTMGSYMTGLRCGRERLVLGFGGKL